MTTFSIQATRTGVALSEYCAFLLSVVQAGESLSAREIGAIRGEINELRQTAQQVLTRDAYDQLIKAARDRLKGETPS